jgi:hypothetical protein
MEFKNLTQLQKIQTQILEGILNRWALFRAREKEQDGKRKIELTPHFSMHLCLSNNH